LLLDDSALDECRRAVRVVLEQLERATGLAEVEAPGKRRPIRGE
jgi:hypothetical protein